VTFGQTYASFVNEEPRPYGTDGDMPGFGTGDTINGRVHSNGQIAISGSPVFYDLVSTTASDFYHGPGYDPIFLGPPPIFGTMPQPLQDMSSNLRAHANHYENPGSDKQQRMVITGYVVTLYTWDIGEAFDSLTALPINFPITNNSCFFTEAPLELMGTNITGRITIGSARQIRIMDDVRVGGPTSGPPQYRVSPSNTNCVGIVSEGDIKIANTPANGRLNSDSLGPDQYNQARTSIVITAAVVAYGSFTFENENDADSGYVCECAPDYRGKIWLYGMIVEGSRGFHWRTNNDGTGYEMLLVHDSRFFYQLPPCFFSEGYGWPHTDPDELNFGDVPLDSTVWDTVDVYVTDFGALALVSAPLPFHAVQIPPLYGYHFTVPVSFHPNYATQFSGVLQVLASGHLFQVPLHGHGVNGGPNIAQPGAYPNPFNSSAAITFEVTTARQATLELFDITGRRVITAFDQRVEPGTQRVIINGESLSTGIYFARLHTPSQERTLKLMLVK
jgi:hypothetical protein